MTSRRRLLRAAAVAAAGLVLASCAQGSTLTAGSPVGRWGSADDEQTHLAIREDGTVQGNDGCNGLGGEWTSADDTVAFADIFMTLMACPGVDSWLAGLDTAVVVDDLLYVMDAEGDRIGVLPRVTADSR